MRSSRHPRRTPATPAGPRTATRTHRQGQRAHEFGIRMTLGAKQVDVLGQVLRQGALLVGLALAVGGVVSLAGMRLLQGLIWRYDPGRRLARRLKGGHGPVDTRGVNANEPPG